MIRIVLSFSFVLLMLAQVNAQSFSTGAVNKTGTSFPNWTIPVTGVGLLSASTKLQSVEFSYTSTASLSDIEMKISCPDGTEIELVDRGTAITGNTYTNTVFTDASTAAITTGSSPYTGSFAPKEGLIANFTGKNANGTWEIDFVDQTYSGGSFTVTNITLNFVNCQQVTGNYTSSKALVNDTLRLCQNESVDFVGVGVYPENNTKGYTQSDGTSDFNWVLTKPDGTDSTFTVLNWSKTFSETGAYLATLRVIDVSGCDSDNDISIPMEVTGKPNFSGTMAQLPAICPDETDSLIGVVEPFFISSGCNPVQTGVTKLPDTQGGAVAYETETTVSCYTSSSIITTGTDIDKVCFTMEHSYVGDLKIELRCPGNQTILLTEDFGVIPNSTYLGFPVDDDTDLTPGVGKEYCFSPSSINVLGAEDILQEDFVDASGDSKTGSIYPNLAAGTYQTDGNDWSGLNGCLVNGDWTLIIEDNITSDNGFLFDWSIEFSSSLPIVTTSANTIDITSMEWNTTPLPTTWNSLPTASAGRTEVTESTSGVKNYTFSVEDEYSCSYDTTVSFTVRPSNDPLCASCDITLLTATPSACDGSLQYTVTGQVDFTAAPTTGTLTITNTESGLTDVYNAPFTSPQTYTIAGNNGDGGTSDIVAVFSDKTNCTLTTTITEPDCCSETPVFTGTDPTQCSPSNGSIAVSGLSSTVSYNIAATQIPAADYTTNGSGVATISSLNSGTYDTWIVIDARGAGCTYNIGTAVVLTDPVDPILTITGTDPTICGGNDGQVVIGGLLASGSYDVSYNGNPTNTYTADGSGNVTISGLTSAGGPYDNWVITNNATGCVTNDATSADLNDPGSPVVTVVSDDGDNTICLGESITLTANVVPVGGTHTPSGPDTWSSGVVFTPAASGQQSYTMTVDNAGCIGAGSIVITVNALPNVNAGQDETICAGANMALTGAGATSYVWSHGELDAASVLAVTGTYTVTGTDGNGCVNTDAVDITVAPLPTVSAGGDLTVCNGNSITLSATGATSYSWVGPTAVTDGVGFVAVSGNYVVTGTDGNGCLNTDDMDVTVGAQPTVDIDMIVDTNAAIIGVDDTTINVCSGDMITLSGTGANTYTWVASHGGSVTDGVAMLAIQGNYTVTGNVGPGCESTAMVTVIVKNLPTVNAGFDASICDGGTVTLAGSGASSYVWDNGVTDGDVVTPTDTTTYAVIGTDANGCNNTDQLTVTFHELPLVEAGANDSICSGNSITLSGSGAATYAWTGPTAVSDGIGFVPLSGKYYVTGTDAFGCINTDSMEVGFYAEEDASFAYDGNYCLIDTAVLPSSVQTNGTYSVTGVGSFSFIDNNTGELNLNVSTSGIYTVYHTVNGNCPDTDSQTVILNNLPQGEFNYDNLAYCQTENVNQLITPTVAGLNFIETISTFPSTGLSFDSVTGEVDVNSSVEGVYSVINTIAASNTCPEVKDTTELTVNALPTATIDPDDVQVCEMLDIRFINANSGSGTITYDYFMDGIFQNGSTASSETLTFPEAGVVEVLLEMTTIAGCIKRDSILITVVDRPQINASDVEGCEQSSLGISANVTPLDNVNSTTWSLAKGDTDNVVISDPSTLNTTVEGVALGAVAYLEIRIDDDACGDILDTIQLGNNPTTVVSDAGEDILICNDDQVALDGNFVYQVGVTGEWSVADSTVNVVLSDSSKNDANVSQLADLTEVEMVWTVKDESCPKGKTDTMKIMRENPVSSIIYNEVTELPAQVTLQNIGTEGDYTWTLSNGEQVTNSSPTLDIDQDGFYLVSLEVRSLNGCVANDTVMIKVGNPIPIFMPNAFTPIGKDDINDYYGPVGDIKDLEDYEFIIFNRLGEKVFETNNPLETWDGSVQGASQRKLEQGAYVWKLKFKYPMYNEDEVIKMTGAVLLLD